MTAGPPWSVKGIDPKAREAAKDLARRSGMTLGEWLNQVILDDEAAPPPPAPVAPAKPVYRRAAPPVQSRDLSRDAVQSRDDVDRLSHALDELASRIEAAESRTAEMVGGVDQTVSALVARLDGAERETAARFEGLSEDARSDQLGVEQSSVEALQAMEGTIAKVAGRLYDSEAENRELLTALRGDLDRMSARLEQKPDDNASLVEAVVASIAERLVQAEERTTSAIQALEASFSSLDNRLGAAESRLADPASSGRLEDLAVRLSADVDAVRSDMAEQIQAAADGRLDRVERALEEISGHVKVAERRSADALERMGHEVLRLADAFGRKVEDVERRSAYAIEQVGGDVARIADTVEARLGRADAVGAQALEKLGGEIARITERLAERISNAERRSAQAIDDIGDQVSRVTERLQERQERVATDLAERIRMSEERTATLLQGARARIDHRLETTYRQEAEDAAAAWAEEPLAAEALVKPQEEEPAHRSFAGAALLEPSHERSEAAFEAEQFEEPYRGVAEEEREPDLITPEPVNFVAQRFGAIGPVPYRAALPEAPAAEAALGDEFVHDAFAEGEAPVAGRLHLAEPVAEHLEEEEAEDDFSPGVFARDALARRFEPEAYEAPEELHGDEPSAEDGGFGSHALARGFEPEAEEAHEAYEEPAEAFEDDVFDDERFEHAAAHVVGDEADEPHRLEFRAPLEERSFEAALEAETLPFGQAEASEPVALNRAMTTRELIEQARAAARTAALAADPKARKAAAKAESGGGLGLGGLSLGLSRKPKRRSGSAMGAALVISGGAAALGVGAAGYMLLAGQPSGSVPPRVLAALGLPHAPAQPHKAAAAATATADPMAAVALGPQPIDPADAQSATPTLAAAANDTGAQLYGDAVRRIEARDFTGLDGLRKAANLGYAPAEFYLAKLYETGEAGLKKDLGEARRWTERAAETGDRKAMHNLALYYVEGSGGPKNTATAAQWFRRAADLGLIDSQYNLGRLYEEGFGVQQNPAEAYKWYLIAAHAGDTESRASAQRLKSQLSAEAQSAAERAAGAFQAQQPRAVTTQLAQAVTPGDVAGAAIAQRALSRLGYYQGPTDGSPSPALHLAIQAYQRDQGLSTTGVPDAALSQRLAVIAQ